MMLISIFTTSQSWCLHWDLVTGGHLNFVVFKKNKKQNSWRFFSAFLEAAIRGGVHSLLLMSFKWRSVTATLRGRMQHNIIKDQQIEKFYASTEKALEFNLAIVFPKTLVFYKLDFFWFQFLLCFIQPLCFCVLLQHFAIHWCFLGCSASDLSEPPYQLAQINRNVAWKHPHTKTPATPLCV